MSFLNVKRLTIARLTNLAEGGGPSHDVCEAKLILYGQEERGESLCNGMME